MIRNANIEDAVAIVEIFNHAPNTMIEWNVELDKILVLFEEREEVVKRFLEEQ